VVAHLWVAEAERGRGLGRALLQAAEAEAARRGCEQILVSTHSFQAPAFYERLGYQRQAMVPGQPKGHANIVYLKRLGGQSGT
jgi:ribosomal protein S18 acetylase RimI-like enzyme